MLHQLLITVSNHNRLKAVATLPLMSVVATTRAVKLLSQAPTLIMVITVAIIKATLVLLRQITLTETTQNCQAANTVKLYLNSNSYVYNNKGRYLRGKNNYIKKNKAVTASGKLRKTNSVKRYYIMKYNSPTGVMNSNENLFNYLYWLPYKK